MQTLFYCLIIRLIALANLFSPLCENVMAESHICHVLQVRAGAEGFPVDVVGVNVHARVGSWYRGSGVGGHLATNFGSVWIWRLQ